MSTDHETVANLWDMRCPHCGDCNHIDIAATVWVRLTRDGTDADEAEGGDHTWSPDSEALCTACRFEGKVSDFSTTDKGAAA
jgi:hypothetical protein